MSSRLWTIEDWDERAREARFCLKELARQQEVPVRTLRRFLWERLGSCPREWLRELRMECAADLLARGKPVNEVAALLSYGSASQFSRAFKAHHGFAPKTHLKRIVSGKDSGRAQNVIKWPLLHTFGR